MTRDELKAAVMRGQMRCTGHINYGRDGGGYPFQHIDFPRLKIIERTKKTPRRVYTVDGILFEDFDAAIDALMVPARLTVAELEALDHVEGRMKYRDILCSLAGVDSATSPIHIDPSDPRYIHTLTLWSLREKGLLICEGGVCWKREATEARAGIG